MLIKLVNISYRYETQEDHLFEQVNLEIDKNSKIGLLGDNGTGKTTLFQIIRGKFLPDKGQRIQRRKGVSIGFLDQNPPADSARNMLEEVKTDFQSIFNLKNRLTSLENEMREHPADPGRLERYGELQEQFERKGGYLLENRIEAVLSGLGFEKRDWGIPFSQLSAGQQNRVQLAKLLIKAPDLLLLDEPTNHLDIEGMEWLEDFLSKYKGAFIVISHDRYFLDQVTQKIWEISKQKVSIYSGNYSFYQAEIELKARKAEEAYTRRVGEIKRLKRAAAAQSKKATRVAGKPRNMSNYNPKAKAFYRSKGARIEKRAKIIRNRINEIRKIGKPERERTHRIDFQEVSRSGEFVCVGQRLSKSYGNKQLFHELDFVIRSGDRIALMGPNGCGKTTLLKIILGKEKPDTGEILSGSRLKIGYSAQDLTHLNDEESILTEVSATTQAQQDWVRTVLGCLELEQDKVFQPVGQLSPGEKNKVSIAKILLSHANFLVLDEPTNHLDIRTREMLEDALVSFTGTILLVSHDRRFIEKVATDIWNFWTPPAAEVSNHLESDVD